MAATESLNLTYEEKGCTLRLKLKRSHRRCTRFISPMKWNAARQTSTCIVLLGHDAVSN